MFTCNVAKGDSGYGSNQNEEYTLADFHVFYQIENDMLDCKVYCPGFNLIGNPENKKEMSMYLLELAIGQLAYEAYICRVDFIDTPGSNMKFCQMMDFYEVIMALVEKIIGKNMISQSIFIRFISQFKILRMML